MVRAVFFLLASAVIAASLKTPVLATPDTAGTSGTNQTIEQFKSAVEAKNQPEILRLIDLLAHDTKSEEETLDEIADTDRKDAIVLAGLKRTSIDPNQAQAHAQYAESHEKYEKARQGYVAALNLFRQVRCAFLEIYSIYYSIAGLPAKSVQACKESLAICPSKMVPAFESMLAYNLALVCLDDQVGSHAKLVLAATEGDGMMPLELSKATALEALAQVKQRQFWQQVGPELRAKYAGELVKIREQQVQVNPDAHSMVCLATALFDAGRKTEAEKASKDAISLFETKPFHSKEAGDVRQEQASYHLALSHYFIKIGDLPQALKSAAFAVDNFWGAADLADAKSCRAYCRLRMGDREGASDDWNAIKPALRNCPSLQLEATRLLPEFQLSDKIGTKRALIVGIGNFSDGEIPKLRYSTKDALDVRNFLITKAGFASENVTVLLDKDAGRDKILTTLQKNFIDRAAPDDLVFFFISSHGTPAVKDPNALNYLVAYDTTKEHFFTEGIPMRKVSNLLAAPNVHSFLVVDTCYSGGLAADGRTSPTLSDVDQLLFSAQQIAVCSSSSAQKSWESKRYANGIFTRQMLDALATNPRYANFQTVFSKVKASVTQEAAADDKAPQTPTLAGLWNGVGLMK